MEPLRPIVLAEVGGANLQVRVGQFDMGQTSYNTKMP